MNACINSELHDCCKINIQPATVRSRLDAWFALHRVSKAGVAKTLRISPSRLNQLLHGIYLDSDWRARLVAAGIPADLLPGNEAQPESVEELP